MTGSGSSGGAGRAFTSATHFSRFGASPGVLVTPREQPTKPSTSAIAARARSRAPSRMKSARISGTPLLLAGGWRIGCFLLADLVLVPIAGVLDRTGQLERAVGRDALAVLRARLQRDVVHGHDDHARQRCHAADESTELVIAADHAQRDRLLGVELLRLFRTR